MKNKLFIIILLGLLLIVGMFFFNKSDRSPKGITIDKNKYPITGIDLSQYSGKVDFEKMRKEENPDFVFLRASAGNNKKDSKLELYYNDAVKNKFVVGFYHYYRFNEDPIEQANFFIQHIKSKKTILPLIVDVEEWGNESSTKTKTEITKNIETFIKHVELEMKSEMMIYTNESGYYTYVKDKIENREIWICSFRRRKKLDNNWLFWQHSHKGKYASVNGWVDINTFNGNRKEWNAFLENRNK